MTARPRRSQQERRAVSERRVLEAAIEVVDRGGVRALTFAEVGRAAGYSRSIVTHRFGSRQALMLAVASELQSRLALELALGPGLDRLLRQVETYLDAIGRRPRDIRVFMLLWIEAIKGDPELRAGFVARDRGLRAVLAESVKQGIADRTINPGADPDAVAVAVAAQLRGIALQLMVTPGAGSLDRVCEHVVAGLRASLGAGPPIPAARPSGQ